MSPLQPIDWEILDATADDFENLEQIYLSICFEFLPDESTGRHSYRRIRGTLLLQEVADRIRSLVEMGLLAVAMDDEGHPPSGRDDLSFVWKAWFTMTPEGRRLWAAAEPADLVEWK